MRRRPRSRRRPAPRGPRRRSIVPSSGRCRDRFRPRRWRPSAGRCRPAARFGRGGRLDRAGVAWRPGAPGLSSGRRQAAVAPVADRVTVGQQLLAHQVARAAGDRPPGGVPAEGAGLVRDREHLPISQLDQPAPGASGSGINVRVAQISRLVGVSSRDSQRARWVRGASLGGSEPTAELVRRSLHRVRLGRRLFWALQPLTCAPRRPCPRGPVPWRPVLTPRRLGLPPGPPWR